MNDDTLEAWLTDHGVSSVMADTLLTRGGQTYRGRDRPLPLSPEDRSLAFILAFELESRITTQDLGFQVGHEATAAASVASLFGTVRAHATRFGASATRVAALAQWMLNAHVRPYTARWHGLAEKQLLATGDHSRRFRVELAELRDMLRAWCSLFRCIADPEVRWTEGLEPPTPRERPQELNATPAAASQLHRAELEVLGGPTDTLGLAISGGGIRSATFALGVLQGLAEVPLVTEAAFVSTVSGGGYLGTLLAAERADTAEVALDDAARHVRQHSRAMASGWALSVVVPWLIGVTTTLAPAVAVLVALVWLVEAGDLVPPLVAGLGVGAALIGGTAGIVRSRGRRRAVEPAAALFAAGLGLGALIVADEVIQGLGRLVPLLEGLEASAIVTAALAALALARRRLSDATLLIPLLVILVLAAAVALQPVLVGTLGIGWSLAIGIAALLWVALPDANGLTLRHHYEDRLVRTWIREPSRVEVPLQALAGCDRGPIQLWNVAWNLSSEASRRPELNGRPGALLTVSALGAECPGIVEGRVWGTTGAPLTVREAMSISGAAVSPLMGSKTMLSTRAWLALLNGRMGAWVRNPRHGGRTGYVPGIYVLRELLGLADAEGTFVHLSDGGHVENLGVLPLLRRRCRHIVAIDGEADPDHTFDGLWRLQLRARLDLGAELDIDTTDLELDDDGRCASHAIAVPIAYANGQRGVMIYIKLSVTGDEPQLVSGYRSQHPSFPHESTSDQVFDEAQFEAYRTLGEHIGSSLTGAPWLPDGPPERADGWVQELARQMQDTVGEGPWQSGAIG